MTVTSLPFTSGPIPVGAATNDAGVTPSCDTGSNTDARQGVWFVWTATFSGTAVLSQTSSVDTSTSVWTGSCGSLTQLTCSDPEGSSFTAVQGTTYHILVSKWGTTPYSASDTVNLTVLQGGVPANDTCANARTVPSVPYSSGLIAVGSATNDAEVNASCDTSANTTARQGVWFVYSPGTSFDGVLSVSGGQDTATSVWTGACGALTQLQCSDPEASSVSFSAGTTYYILVSKFSTSAYSASAAVGLSIAQAPANDQCASAAPISPSMPASVTGDLSFAGPFTTITPSVCASSSRDVFYTFTPAVSTNYSFTLCNLISGSLDTVLTIHSGCPGDNSTLIAGRCNDDGCSGAAGPSALTNVPLDAGVTYTVRVAMFSTKTGGPFRLDVSSEAFGACCTTAGACSLVAQSACAAGSTFTGAAACSTSACQGSCCNTATGACTLAAQDSCTGAFGGIGSTCTTVPCATVSACCNPATGACTITGTDPCPSGTSPSAGATCSPNPCPQPPPPSNDDCANAAPLALGAGAIPGTNVNATASYATLPSWCTGSTIDVYYSVTTPGPQSVKISVFTAATDDLVAIVALANCGDTTNLGCAGIQDDPTLTFAVPGAGTYFVRVATFTGDQTAFTVQAETIITGACCNATSGVCTSTTSAACTGAYQGDNTVCDPTPCSRGACCNTTSGSCSLTSPAGCSGAYQGDNSVCSAALCGQGACCTVTGACSLSTLAGCASGSFNDGLTCSTNPCPQPPAPANDACASATVIPSLPYSSPVINVGGATDDSDANPSCDTSGNSAGARQGVWFTFNSGAGGLVRFAQTESQDTATSVWTGACGALTQVNCSDPESSTFTTEPGTTYYVLVSKWNTTNYNGGAVQLTVAAAGACCDACGACSISDTLNCSGTLTLGAACSAVTCPPAPGLPGNDDCASAVTITGASFAAAVCNDTATADGPAGGTCNTSDATTMQNSVWYRFVAPSNGTLTVGGSTRSYDGILSVYAAADCGSLSNSNAVLCVDEPDEPYPGSAVNVIAGQTYFIAYGDWSTTEGGGATLVSVSFAGTAGGVCCRGSTCDTDTANCTVVAGSQAGAFVSTSGSTCNASGNNNGPCCKADYNKMNNVELLDIFAFLNDWFGNRPYADFNGQNGVDLLDIFAFLTAWFAGPCP